MFCHELYQYLHIITSVIKLIYQSLYPYYSLTRSILHVHSRVLYKNSLHTLFNLLQFLFNYSTQSTTLVVTTITYSVH